MNKITAQLTRLRVTIAALIIVVIILGAFAISQNRPVEGLPDLATTVVAIKDVEKIVKADGNIAGNNSRDVYFPSQSKVKEIRASVGKQVSRDEVLAVLETVNAFGSVESQEITAPIAGIVTTINYRVNDIIYTPTQPAMRVVNISRYIVEVGVNENDVIDLRKAQQAKFLLPAISLDETFDGEVIEIAPEPISIQGSIDYLVKLSINDVPSALRLGMSVEVEILADKVEDVLAIPENFLIERNEEYFVKRLNWLNIEKTDYEVQEVEVEVGLITDELVEVESGLRSGDELLEPSFNSGRTFGLFGGNN